MSNPGRGSGRTYDAASIYQRRVLDMLQVAAVSMLWTSISLRSMYAFSNVTLAANIAMRL